MAVPAYITNEHVFYSDVTTEAALLLDGSPQWLLPWQSLVDQRSQDDLDVLVQANGGSLPLSDVNIAKTTILDNGQSWYDTYIGATKYVVLADLFTYAVFHNPYSSGGGGGGGSYVLPPATQSVLGGVSVPADGGLVVDGSGAIAVDPNGSVDGGDF